MSFLECLIFVKASVGVLVKLCADYVWLMGGIIKLLQHFKINISELCVWHFYVYL